MYETFLKMDELLLSKEGVKELKILRDNDEDQSYAGCTANVAILTQTELYVANCGDSRSIIRTGNVNNFNKK